MNDKTEARLETGFIILYDEGEWLVGYYRHKDRTLSTLHIFNKDSWGALENEKNYRLDNIPNTVRERYMFWLHMTDE